ncbi:lysophospholipid acyltransferase family protein [Halopseudomonas salegens]|uniref:1-acyl-sn-glycerol-3-phosphate acyltransferase n=1 Tax=Halopseudomonas salegens TaxID=1434072 RepID=A0A1H2GA29_9GAMM|nr:lysophospholipid acyltransferase family protein [Halopseudomonas salegens]SDU16586.1 1-acyl-sn-glycerol-3-phosphate acyltransferase [Halopseudomonas salegens]
MTRLPVFTESANLARRIGVVLGSVLVTAGFCIDVLVRAAFRRLDRSRVDRYTRRWAALLLRLVRMDLHVVGQAPELNDGRRYIILCNHASHYDIPAIFAAMPGSIRMLAKAELYRIPLLGITMRTAEFPSINRRKRNQALKDLDKARAMMESGIVLWAAPEGTRSLGGELLPFKKGCFHLALDTEAVIIPVGIRGISKVLPARSWRFNLGQPVSVHIGEPIDTRDYSRAELESLMLTTRHSIQGLMGEVLDDQLESGVGLAVRDQSLTTACK